MKNFFGTILRFVKRNPKMVLVGVGAAVVLGVGMGVLTSTLLHRAAGDGGASTAAVSSAARQGESGETDTGNEGPVAAPSKTLPEEMRAMWISYIEWESLDISTEEKMREEAGVMFDNCVDLGLNTAIVAVRPFSDALYKSAIYPWSHVLTGTQGQDPGYDPLAVLVEEAHARGLRIEAWINPYRVSADSNGPLTLSDTNPAVLHPEWAHETSGVWYDPGLPEVQQMVVDGVREIVQNYDVDGIHFDDYFYPETTVAADEEGGETDAGSQEFDAATFARYGGGKELAAWRRANVDTLVQAVYGAVKEQNPDVSFGISPQGNNQNNYDMQYSDVCHWMATPGFVDYVMPQLYWGFGYRTSSGREDYAFANISATWAGYERAETVKLYAGLGAYRVGDGDGGSNDQAEWRSGHNVADMVAHLRTVKGFSGFALFRYQFLCNPPEAIVDYVDEERLALTELLVPQGADAGGDDADAKDG